ncbi:penicillin acylase family protein [Sansalvadorimonas sp. 2012CJ34-2]|uniref:Penicillin acylase family protein n=1 Tax=Parendozoicomonas callyspongiae TaxID=2942213 RepID=A0ABT0PNC7_9GAMM|nr:penicillin acylase family protein [Sansalvadorimonas sp. 2012CJ34-2]MCL6271963.1 penicillin acylase family protein [Sansalvadorimonas sp. 2012CJ34-2]
MLALIRRWLLLVLVLAVIAILSIYGFLSLSLPQLDGTVSSPDVQLPVRVDRDRQGIPTVTGKTRSDVAFATGYLHAQDRFFQMDLGRRNSAGELSELVGKAALEHDRSVRIHLFRRVAEQVVENLSEDERELLQAYTAGVNQGLSDLDSWPFEYLLLRTKPAFWKPEDTFLTVFSMYLDLSDDQAGRDAGKGFIASVAGRGVANFISPSATPWEAPLDNSFMPEPDIPGEDQVNLRLKSDRDFEGLTGVFKPSTVIGSNNFAVSGNLSEHDGAIVEDDMHLSLRVPTIWYRMQFVYGEDGQESKITGVTLPGTPFMVVGSNGSVAWAFTNSQGDWSDRVMLEVTEDDHYITPDGPVPFQNRFSTVKVSGDTPQTMQVRYSIWGPVVRSKYDGSLQAIRWTAHNSEATNAGLYKLEQASDVSSAIEIANASGVPPQNFVVGDKQGNIGWSIAGRVPNRIGVDSTFPLSWREAEENWNGWLPLDQYPRVINPASDRIWTANARVVGGENYQKLGDGGYSPGARSLQIRDELMARQSFQERDLLDVSLDDRAVYMSSWRQVALNALDAKAMEANDGRVVFKAYIDEWTGRAVVDDVGYRLVREFQDAVKLKVLMNLGRYFTLLSNNPEGSVDDGWIQELKKEEVSVLRLLERQPDNWLPPAYGSWNELVLETIDEVISELGGVEALPLKTWGERNTARIRHPLSGSIPYIGEWLNMPAVQLAGDNWMPRAQQPDQGVSERMIVSPGNEEEGIMHIPGGQSGHPLSSFYQSGFYDWLDANPSPFLPGASEYTLMIIPGE